MIIKIGKYKGKSVGVIIFKHHDYVNLVLQETNLEEPLLRSVRNEMIRLVHIFDSKPFLRICYNHNCGKPATRSTAYKDNYRGLYLWCDNCDPYQSGASPGTLHIVSTYQDVLKYVRIMCQNRKTDHVAFIKKLAQEKGLPKRVTNDAINQFFYLERILTF